MFHNKIQLFLVLFATSLFLAGCGASNHLSKSVRSDLGIGKVVVKMGKNSWWAKNALPADVLKQNLTKAVKARTAPFNGSSIVDIRITINDYYIPDQASSVLLGMTPYIGSRIALINAKTGKVIGKEETFNITVNDFDGGNWFVVSSMATKFDTNYPVMIGLYARKLALWLKKARS